MSITAIGRYFVGDPNIVSIVTDDTLAEITTAGYLELPNIVADIELLQNGEFQWTDTDLVLIHYSPSLIGFFVRDALNNTFSASSLQATGGSGGTGGITSTVTAITSLGGAGGIGSNGDFNSGGAPGIYGFCDGSGTNVSGNGGSSHYGGGALGALSTVTGIAASNYGSGGSGGSSTTVSRAGGAGTAGLIVVWEFA